MTRRKTAGQRQRRNTRDVGELTKIDGGEPAPPCPRPAKGSLLKVTQEMWAEYWGSPVADLVDRRSDLPALRRLFLLYDERERALRSYQAQRHSKGSTGQLIVNPFAKEVASLDGRIASLEDRFGLTPKARLDLGVSFGAAAKSLEDLARKVEDAQLDDDTDEEEDPRLSVVDTTAREA